MNRLCIKSDAWNIRQQIDVEFEEQSANFVAWFEQEYGRPALYIDEGGQG